MRRLLSIALALAMITPALASVAEAAVGTWLSPPPGETITANRVEVSIGFNTQSDLKVTTLELYVDGKFYARKFLSAPATRGVCSFWWDTSNIAPGSYKLVARIFAGDKLISTVSGTGTVARGGGIGIPCAGKPSVAFSNIKSGDVLKGTTKIRLQASADSGSPLVSLLVDDQLKMVRNTPPYNYDLDTTTYSDGSHQLKTFAYDTDGNRSDPAVVKVEFKNGLKRPVVAAIMVEHDPDLDWTDSEIAQSLPAVASKNSAAAKASPAPAEPVVTVEISSPAPVAKSSSPAVTAAPLNTTVNVPAIASRGSVGALGGGASAARAAQPAVMEGARSSDVRQVVTAKLPDSKWRTTVPGHSDGIVAEPEAPMSASVSVSEAVVVAVVPSSLRSQSSAHPSALAPAVPGTAMGEPVSGDAVDVVAEASPSVDQTPAADPYTAPGKLDAPAVAEQPGVAPAKPMPKPVQSAMAPDIGDPRVKASIVAPPPAPRSTKARIEKTTVPFSGKVKARSLFEGLGGVLFWDPGTRTVTAYVNELKIEMQIGSKVAKVNGVEMDLDAAPYIADGRTVIDTQLYHRACALVAGGGSAI